MNTKYNIEDLFRNKLEEVEVVPSPHLWARTSRVLRRRQFLRFNPARWNIYYVGGLLLAGAAAVTYFSLAEPTEKAEGQNDPVALETLPAERQDTAAAVKESSDRALPAAEESRTIVATGEKTDKEGVVQNTEETEQPQENTGKEIIEAEGEPELPLPVSTMVAYFASSAHEGCAPLSVEFTNLSINAAEVEWSFGKGLAATGGPNPRVTYNEAGSYTITLMATDFNGLQLSHTEIITVHPRPAASFELTDRSIYNYSADAVAFGWWLLDGKSRLLSNEFQPSLSDLLDNQENSAQESKLLLVAENIFGCSDSAVAPLSPAGKPELHFPTAFSPNPGGSTGGYYNLNDPDNRVFHPRYREAPSAYNLKIFNKAGELIFETSAVAIGWDGYYKEAPAPRGVYIYQCTGNWQSGEPFRYRGDITILRNDH